MILCCNQYGDDFRVSVDMNMFKNLKAKIYVDGDGFLKAEIDEESLYDMKQYLIKLEQVIYRLIQDRKNFQHEGNRL